MVEITVVTVTDNRWELYKTFFSYWEIEFSFAKKYSFSSFSLLSKICLEVGKAAQYRRADCMECLQGASSDPDVVEHRSHVQRPNADSML